MIAFKRYYILLNDREYVSVMAPDAAKASQVVENRYGLTGIPIWEPKFEKIRKDNMKIVGGYTWSGKEIKDGTNGNMETVQPTAPASGQAQTS